MEGRKQVEVAELFGVTRQALGRWVKAYREHGEEALKGKPQGRPKGIALKGWQASKVIRKILGNHPDQLRLPGFLWTRESIGELIENLFGIKLSRWTVGRYLRRWGLSPQKPLRRAYEQDPEAVRRWLNEEYPAIRKQAKKERARIYWGDEMGIRSDHQAGRTWGYKGETPVVNDTGRRFQCNMISAITNGGQLNFMVFTGRFTTEVFLNFLDRLADQNKYKRIHLIMDQHPVHRSKRVRRFLASRKGRKIQMHFLPGYSPELNPDEVLNQDVKTNAVGKKSFHKLEALMSTVRRFLHSRQKRPSVVARYFHEKHVRYAAT
jgi:transposase